MIERSVGLIGVVIIDAKRIVFVAIAVIVVTVVDITIVAVIAIAFIGGSYISGGGGYPPGYQLRRVVANADTALCVIS